MKDNKLFDLYVVYELLYETKMSKKYSDVLLFPNDWYIIQNYKFKIDVLLEALDNDILIVNTKKYQMFSY